MRASRGQLRQHGRQRSSSVEVGRRALRLLRRTREASTATARKKRLLLLLSAPPHEQRWAATRLAASSSRLALGAGRKRNPERENGESKGDKREKKQESDHQITPLARQKINKSNRAREAGILKSAVASFTRSHALFTRPNHRYRTLLQCPYFKSAALEKKGAQLQQQQQQQAAARRLFR